MINIKKGLFAWIFAIILLLIIIVSASGYFITINSADTVSMKYIAEKFLFFGLILLTAFIAAYIIIINSSRNIIRDLNKLIDILKMGQYDIDVQLKKRGEIGEKISIILRYILELNNKKTLRISTLHNIIEFMMTNSNQMIFITDINGKIIYTSKSVSESMKETEREITSIRDIYKDINLGNIISEISASGQSVIVETGTEKMKNNTMRVFPVYNAKRTLSMLIITSAPFTIERIMKQSSWKNIFKNPRGQRSSKN